MKAQSAALTGALAVAGLLAAYVTWQRPAEQTETEATVLDVNKSAIQSVRYEDARRIVEVVPEKDVAWIRQTEKPPPPPPPRPAPTLPDGGVVAQAAPDGGTQDAGTAVASAPPQKEPEQPRTREYRGNDTALNRLEDFAPLRAVRALGVLPDDKLKELGLKDSQRTLQIVTTRGTHTYRLSQDAQGATAPYVRDESDGKVYVVKGTLVSDLEFASSRLVDRKLHTFRDDEYDRIVVSAGGKERTLVKQGQKLADPGAQAPDDFATNWHSRLWNVLGRGELPAAGTPEVQVRIDYQKGGDKVGFIELAKAGNDVFARTEHTAGWVRMHGSTAQILDESKKVVP